MHRNLRSDDTAVSPIVALVFMAGVTIFLTTIVSLVFFGVI